jgi:hypothetical protein
MKALLLVILSAGSEPYGDLDISADLVCGREADTPSASVRLGREAATRIAGSHFHTHHCSHWSKGSKASGSFAKFPCNVLGGLLSKPASI